MISLIGDTPLPTWIANRRGDSGIPTGIATRPATNPRPSRRKRQSQALPTAAHREARRPIAGLSHDLQLSNPNGSESACEHQNEKSQPEGWLFSFWRPHGD